MPRLRRKGKAKFANETERRIWEITQSLHAQRRRNPKGPWTAPRCFAAFVAIRQFRNECKPACEVEVCLG
jgi:hypothetical protein